MAYRDRDVVKIINDLLTATDHGQPVITQKAVSVVHWSDVRICLSYPVGHVHSILESTHQGKHRRGKRDRESIFLSLSRSYVFDL